MEDVDALDLLVADARLEPEDGLVAGLDVADVLEVLERLGDNAQQAGDGVAALVRAEDHRAVEDDVGREDRRAGGEVVLLDGGKEIAQIRADQNGEWVVMAQEPPLSAGQHELRVLQHIEGRAPVTSDQALWTSASSASVPGGDSGGEQLCVYCLLGKTSSLCAMSESVR